MKITERACSFDCHGERLLGIISEPATAAEAAQRGVLFVVGGAQYRAGSHRQYTLMARHFAAQGTPVMRFDVRGMGDSEGETRSFDTLDDDLRAAIDCFLRESPVLQEVILFGLCDAASAIALYAANDARVSGLMLFNPWVRTEAGAARATLKHYYVRRLLQRELWGKLARAEFNYGAALGSLGSLVRAARRKPAPGPGKESAPLHRRMLEQLRRYTGHVLIVLSSEDLTAHEFADLLSGSRDWRSLSAEPRFSTYSLPGADHTFSRREWRERATAIIDAWSAAW